VEELQGCALTELIHPDDLGALRRAHDEAISSGSDEGRVTLRLRTGSGDWRWMSDHGRPVRDEGGSVVGVIDSFRDVQAEHDASEELRRGSEILRGVIDSLSDPWVLLEAVRDESGSIVDMVFVDANEAAGEHNRVSREDIVGARLLAIAPEHGPSGIFERYVRVVESGLTLVEDDVAFTHPVDGEVGWFDNRAVKVGDGISLTWRDVTDRYLRRRELEEQTERDLLTGVANRLQLERRLAQVVGGHRRLASLVAVLYLDLDNFKEINDSLGHAAGDGVLTTVAARIRQALRETDLVARVGGDEFVVILDAISTVEDAQSTAQKVASAIGTPIRSGTMSITPLASIGVAIVGKGQTADEAIAAADHAMYQAKRQGRNRIVVAG
jgi:diguanylate cyclase (GGDEF)-like protein